MNCQYRAKVVVLRLKFDESQEAQTVAVAGRAIGRRRTHGGNAESLVGSRMTQ